MSEIAIKVEGVSKTFRIYNYPTDRIKEAFSLSRKKFHSDYVALKNISFKVKKGEFLGIVGRNGAGKSTLLKILSRELTPTTGQVTINGVVSLLQLGVGFNPELTGIDNARFASRLLGYSNAEIEEMLQEIISFADIGEFIYHPVKTYSTGMYSRLSFAVGININPDILIADEVLSVGDMRFSQKCLRKMREFKERGKTVIFVSHDIQSVNVFCDSALWIWDGEVFEYGDAKAVTSNYQSYMLYDVLPPTATKMLNQKNDADVSVQIDLKVKSPALVEVQYDNIEWFPLEGLSYIGHGGAKLMRMAFGPVERNQANNIFQGNEEVILCLEFEVQEKFEKFQVGIALYNQKGLVTFHTNNDICGFPLETLCKGDRGVAKFRFKLPSIATGNYIFSVGLQSESKMLHLINDAHEIIIRRVGIKGTQCGYVILEEESFEFFKIT